MTNKRKDPGSKRVTMTCTASEYERLTFWAGQSNMSINEYLHECFLLMIDRENGVYDAPDIMQERMNLVVDIATMASEKLDSLSEFITSGFSSLLAAARGDDYIHGADDADDSDGEETDAEAADTGGDIF